MKRMWWRMGKLSGCRGRHEAPHHPGSGQGPQMPIGIPPKKLKEIKKVLEEIRSINKRLQSFESGFISEDGIKVNLDPGTCSLLHAVWKANKGRIASGTNTRASLPVNGLDTALRPSLL